MSANENAISRVLPANCEHCGDKAQLQSRNDQFKYHDTVVHWVECIGCGIGTKYHATAEEAVATWNHRTAREPQPAPALVAKLREALPTVLAHIDYYIQANETALQAYKIANDAVNAASAETGDCPHSLISARERASARQRETRDQVGAILHQHSETLLAAARELVNASPAAPTNNDLEHARKLLAEWINKRGHDSCWYYPEILRDLCVTLGVSLTEPRDMPTRAEFAAGCQQYRNELYGPASEEPFCPSGSLIGSAETGDTPSTTAVPLHRQPREAQVARAEAYANESVQGCIPAGWEDIRWTKHGVFRLMRNTYLAALADCTASDPEAP